MYASPRAIGRHHSFDTTDEANNCLSNSDGTDHLRMSDLPR